jgi:magnesium transporter
VSSTSTLYRDGVCIASGSTDWVALAEAAADGDLAWIDVADGDTDGFAQVAQAFSLHHLAIEDAVHAHQRAKLERYGDMVFCVMRPATYDETTELVAFGELHVFTGPGFVITINHGEAPDIMRVRADLEARPDLLARGSGAVLHALMDRVVDDYAPVAAGIQGDVDEIEDALFSDEHASSGSSKRIYQLTREVIGFQRAIGPLPEMIGLLIATSPDSDSEERRYLRDVQDHVLRLVEQSEASRALLSNLLNVNLTLETKALSERSHAQDVQMKKVSSWAAIIFAPTLVGTIYGMNFDNMPELHWQYGYLWALSLMVLIAVALYVIFKSRDWL